MPANWRHASAWLVVSVDELVLGNQDDGPAAMGTAAAPRMLGQFLEGQIAPELIGEVTRVQPVGMAAPAAEHPEQPPRLHGVPQIQDRPNMISRHEND